MHCYICFTLLRRTLEFAETLHFYSSNNLSVIHLNWRHFCRLASTL